MNTFEPLNNLGVATSRHFQMTVHPIVVTVVQDSVHWRQEGLLPCSLPNIARLHKRGSLLQLLSSAHHLLQTSSKTSTTKIKYYLHKFKQIDAVLSLLSFNDWQEKLLVNWHRVFCICKGLFKIILEKGRQPSKKILWVVLNPDNLVAGPGKGKHSEEFNET